MAEVLVDSLSGAVRPDQVRRRLPGAGPRPDRQEGGRRGVRAAGPGGRGAAGGRLDGRPRGQRRSRQAGPQPAPVGYTRPRRARRRPQRSGRRAARPRDACRRPSRSPTGGHQQLALLVLARRSRTSSSRRSGTRGKSCGKRVRGRCSDGGSSEDPVAAKRDAIVGLVGGHDPLKSPTAPLDHSRRRDVAVVARDEHVSDVVRPGDDQTLAKNLGRIPPPPKRRSHAVADVPAMEGQVDVEPVADRCSPDDLASHVGDQPCRLDEVAEVESSPLPFETLDVVDERLVGPDEPEGEAVIEELGVRGQ